ncbi:MAG: carbohydrate binding domain-containing protein, partial [Planctomycetota bacterium]
MKNRIVWLAVVLLAGFVGICPSYAQEVDNLLVNGGFEDGVLDPWYIAGTNENEIVTELTGAAVPEGPIEGTNALHITVPAAGANYWDTHLKQQGLVFEQGKHYTLSAFFKSKQGTQQFNLKPERDGSPYEGFPEQAFTMTEEWVEYTVTTPVFTETVDPAAIAFHIAYEAGDFWVDGIRFYEGDYVAPPATKPEERAKAL